MRAAVAAARRAARYRLLRAKLRYHRLRREQATPEYVARNREEFETIGTWLGTPPGATCNPVAVGQVPGEWMTVEGSDPDRVLLYLHGGGYVMGSINASRQGLGHYVEASRLTALNIDYRLGPEHPFPAAIDDALIAYRWLLDRFPPEHIAVLGESAGGGLAFAMLLAARDARVPMPAGVVTVSAWADLTLAGGSYHRQARTDLSLSRDRLEAYARLYLDGADPHDPLASPAHADLSGMPPALLLASTAELVYDDTLALQRQLRGAGVAVETLLAPRMLHCWPSYTAYVGRARADLGVVGAWLAERVGAPTLRRARRRVRG